MKALGAKIRHEIAELLPPTLFFIVAFELLAISRTLLLRQYGITLATSGGVILGGLLVGKAVLLSDMLPFLKRLSKGPLVYAIFWKTLLYVVVALLLHYLEHLLPKWWTLGDVRAANRHILDEMIWPHFWVIQLWLSVLLLVYCVVREGIRSVGAAEVRRLYFTHPGAPVKGKDA